MTTPRAWSFLTVSGLSEYQGHKGYDDEPREIYRYDSFVPNHLQVSVGDVVVVRSSTEVIGIAEVTDVTVGQGSKDRFRCPICSKSNLSQRKTMHPAWRCKSGGHEFDQPDVESVPVTTYAAHYGSTFREAGADLTPELLATAVIRPSDQMSIKEIDLAEIEHCLTGGAENLLRAFAAKLQPGDTASSDDTGPKTLIEKRKAVLREIEVRRGQKGFRKRLVKRYGAACQVTGCKVMEIVEAAHIDPYSDSEDNGVGNGLLLRSDIHTLFDLGLIGIEPDSLKIVLHPKLAGSTYEEFVSAPLQTNDGSGPSLSSLKRRWSFFGTQLSSFDASSFQCLDVLAE